MAISKPINRYAHTPVPRQTSVELRNWLDEELDTISLAIDGLITFVESPVLFLYGGADPVLVNTIPAPIINWAEAALRGFPAELPDKATGTIIIPESGLYAGVSYVYGIQSGSPLQNQEIHLLFQKNADPIRVAASFDIATNQTEARVLNASLTAEFIAGDDLSLWIEGTDDLGSMTIVQSSFQMARMR